MESYFEKLIRTDRLRRPAILEAIRWFDPPSGSAGLDAGCGIGSHAMLLAEAIGADGQVTGLELSPEFIGHAQAEAERAGLADRVTFREGDVNAMPFDDDTFDWAWSVDCVGHISIGEPVAGLRELSRVVRPEGRVAILGYSSQLLLPGHPRLEARLNATASTVTALGEQAGRERHFMVALGWLRESGLEETSAGTVVGTVHAPLADDVRGGLTSLFGMLWGEMEPSMTNQDRADYRRLTDPQSPDFILDRPDYCGFFTYSVFVGRVGDRPLGP